MSAKKAPFKSKFVAEISDVLLAEDRAASVRRALDEDIGSGDVTASLVDEAEHAHATIIVREPAMLCGRAWVALAFELVDPSIKIHWHADDGDLLKPDQTVCEIQGPARALLTAERTALNFLQTLTGTATTTHHYVAQVTGTDCRLLDTRKTIPGLRLAQKYATAIGGAKNHRIGLFDAILIKENHIASAGSIANAIDAARRLHPSLPIETEVESLDELAQALDSRVDRVLLDNFPPAQLRKAVAINNAHATPAELEASGGIEQDQLHRIAATGVHFISIGALTKHVRATDFSMRFVFEHTTNGG